MRAILAVAIAVLTESAYAQAPPKEFEVASVRPSSPDAQGQGRAGLRIDGSHLTISRLSLKDYVALAFKLKTFQVSGPDWINREKFDITATMSSPPSRDELAGMMRALLIERFGLKTHTEKRATPVYALVQAKGGLKIKEDAPDSEPVRSVAVDAAGSAQGVAVDLGNGSSFRFANNKLDCVRMTMASLADTLWRFTDKPVVDMMEVTGAYTFQLEVTPEDYRAMLIRSAVSAGVSLPQEALRLMESSSGDSLHAALEKIGIKLDSRKAPLDFLVVDEAKKTPSEN